MDPQSKLNAAIAQAMIAGPQVKGPPTVDVPDAVGNIHKVPLACVLIEPGCMQALAGMIAGAIIGALGMPNSTMGPEEDGKPGLAESGNVDMQVVGDVTERTKIE